MLMTEKELISKLQELKQIKPRNTWVLLAKMDILGSDPVEIKEVATPVGNWSFSNALGLIFQKKLAYAFAALLFIFGGVIGVMEYRMPHAIPVAVKSQTDVIAENTLRSNVEDFKEKSKNLADAVKDKSQNSELAIKEVKDAATKLTNELQKNPGLAKVVALDVNNNKSILDIPGGNNASEVIDVYKTLVIQLIKDFDATTLTPAQKGEFDRIKTAFNNGGDSATALRDLLLMNANNTSTSSTDSTDSKK